MNKKQSTATVYIKTYRQTDQNVHPVYSSFKRRYVNQNKMAQRSVHLFANVTWQWRCAVQGGRTSFHELGCNPAYI